MSVKCILTQQTKPGTGSGGTGIVLKKLEITKYPHKTIYFSGESFDPTGLELTASYGIPQSDQILTTGVIPVQDCLVAPTTILDSTEYINISYTKGGITVSTKLSITVNPSITELIVSYPPSKIIYSWGDTFSSNGLILKARYSNGTENSINTYSLSIGDININNSTMLNNSSFIIGANVVSVSYTEENQGKTVSTSFEITINRKQLAVPSQTGTLVYNGNNQSPQLSNFNNQLMEISGNTQTNAGTYTAIIRLVDAEHYEWNDGTIVNKNISWSIGKAQGTLSVDKQSLEFTKGNLNQSLVITRAGNGVISYSPISIAGLTFVLTENNLNITWDGATQISTSLTISVGQGINHTSPPSVSISITATLWGWGEENEVGDTIWWSNLQNWILNNSSLQDRLDCVGKQKKVILTSPLLGTTEHMVRCIGADQDGDKTLAFQTSNCLKTEAYFDEGVNGTDWIGSEARDSCKQYYQRFPGKDFIRSLERGTCKKYVANNDRNVLAEYESETVFLLSEREIGLDKYSPLSVANSTMENAECTRHKNFSYNYYTDNNNRIKKFGDNGQPTIYWLRSKTYYTSPGSEESICGVTATGTFASVLTLDIWGDRFPQAHGFSPAFVIG